MLAAAVVLDPSRHIPGLRDSKQLSPLQRERLYSEILERASGWSVGSADAREVDKISIGRASLAGMGRALVARVPLPDFALVDAFQVPGLPMAQRGIIKGDARCASIAAASIVAKVTRDRLMCELDERDPRYGFSHHKGYATAEHLEAVARHGYSDAHRRTFRQPTLFDTMDG